MVEEVKNAQHAKLIAIGSWLHAVDGNTVRRVPFETVVRMLQELPRPLKCTFGKVVKSTEINPTSNDDNSPTFSTPFYSLPMGLTLRPGAHSAAIVVGSSPAFSISTSAMGSEATQVQVRKPRVGAMITEVNGVCVLGKAFEDVLKICAGDSEEVLQREASNPVLTLKFSEIPSDLLPSKTTFTLSLSSIQTTVINDITGAEIPTLRMAIGKVAVKVSARSV